MFPFAIRIISVDFYMSNPINGLDTLYSEFRGTSINQIPVIRIFGTTDDGKKICLHVHGVFPYFYIPYDGCEDSSRLQYQIAANIDKAVNISFGQTASTSQHVYKVALVAGIPFYGYHPRQHQFFKIFLYNPILIRKVSNLLQNDTVLGKHYQPHESHVPFTLQFMIDYNLHGMSKIYLNHLKFRKSGESSIIDENLYLPSTIKKQSICELEADTTANEILNNLDIINGKLMVNPGIHALWEDERQRRRLKNDHSQIGSCLTLENKHAPPTKSHEFYRNVLTDRLAIVSDDSVDDLNRSVYPAETPPDNSLLNASFVDSPSLTPGSELDETLNLDSTLRDDAKDLFNILQELEQQQQQDREDDSILSQNLRDDEDDDEDLESPLEFKTPIKTEDEDDLFERTLIDESQDRDEDVDLFETTLVPQLDNYKKRIPDTYNEHEDGDIVLPQLDGNYDSNSDVDSPKRSKNLKKAKRKLGFSGGSQSSSSSTIIEEHIDCELKPDYVIDNFEKSPNKKQILHDYFSCRSTDESRSSENRTIAEIYDQQTNFIAKEGPSTRLTQSSDSELFEMKSSQNYRIKPGNDVPERWKIIESLDRLNLPKLQFQQPFYSDPNDVTGNLEIGYNVLKVSSRTTQDLDDFKTLYSGIDDWRKLQLPVGVKWAQDIVKNLKLSYCTTTITLVTPIEQPPSLLQIKNWIKSQKTCPKLSEIKKSDKIKVYLPASQNNGDSDSELSLTISQSHSDENQIITSPVLGKNSKNSTGNSSGISGITLNDTYGFKLTPENYQTVKTNNNYQYLTILVIELHITTRGDLKPDPDYDQIQAIFYSIYEDSPETHQNRCGVIAINSTPNKGQFLLSVDNVVLVDDENGLLLEFVRFLRKLDPDIITGYETEMLSWGYLIDRAKFLKIDIIHQLSRVEDKSLKDDQNLRITGRIILDFWRLLRHEIALQSYTFESISYHILHHRIPDYSFKDLTNWWCSPLHRHRTVSYYSYRVGGVLKIMEQLDLIGRTSELARLFGIQFYEVLSRGSQFRVESMMLRLAKPLNFISVSPSVQQRAQMKAPEFLPLILEPESKMYVDPVIVLDFQSLYPSIIIAYNYCFSTCVGKVHHLGRSAPFEFGATQLKISKSLIAKLLKRNCLNFSPCGVAFVKSHIRDGILPRMLREILDTRLMVKQSMKQNKDDKILQKVLHNRQLGLKLIANVTYGYTAANFSGRMPAVELGDSVVSKGRETLQRAIQMVENTPEWGARVVYGDTDSLFVTTPGRTRWEAFEIGKKIAEAVTNDNPDPVKLKLEKVYQPSILQTKKRYVGYMYENPDQIEPIYEAKGIETVRRDGCPAVSKMLEKSLRLLFETKDVSLVKRYVVKQFHKILTGRISLQDLTFAKEYRGVAGYKPGACVPSLELAKKWMAVDRRSEPRTSSRVPYIICNGPPGMPLIRLVRSPRDFLNDPNLKANSLYYITKVIIPPINRCFKLIGVDLNQWFNQMPRKLVRFLPTSSPTKKTTISQYFITTNCMCCGQQTQNGLCDKCLRHPQETVVVLTEKLQYIERAWSDISLICQSCTSMPDIDACVSLDCPVMYKRHQSSRNLQQTHSVRELLKLPQYQF